MLVESALQVSILGVWIAKFHVGSGQIPAFQQRPREQAIQTLETGSEYIAVLEAVPPPTDGIRRRCVNREDRDYAIY